jgi:serine/threonine-protein kinase
MSDAREVPPTGKPGLIGTRVGNYEIKTKLGEGGMGAVYLGEHPLIGKKVAIKVLLEELVSNESIATRFFNEAKAANDIRHQNIVDVVDFGKIAKAGGGFVIYIIMEFLEGKSLAARLRQELLPLAVTQHILQQCCSGLAASHAKGIIHRDLKPDNLFIISRGGDDTFVKILDFGIAKLTASAGVHAKTRTGTLIGTPAYMSPEQCAGRGKIDARSDIYSLGVVMYEMLTGQVPFSGEGFGDIVVAHLMEKPRPPSELRRDLPAAWEKIVLRALEKDPDHRFQTMEELGIALANPEVYAMSPQAVAHAGLVAAAPTTAVPAVSEAGASPVSRAALADRTTQKDAPAAAIGSEYSAPAGKRDQTTLSEAASEVRATSPSTTKRAAVIGISAAIALVAAAVGVARYRGEKTPTSTPLSPVAVIAPVVPKPPETVLVKLATNPPGAQVLRSDEGDAPVGVTPLTLRVDKGHGPFDVSLKLDGYKVEKRTVDSEANTTVEILLTREVIVAAPKKRRAPSSKAPATDEDHKLIAPEL